jgi:hypothetical protein
MAHIIKADGTEVPLPDTKLETLQAAVGGYIELIPLGNSKLMLVDEEGLMKDVAERPDNLKASTLYGRRIVGDVVICESSEMD